VPVSSAGYDSQWHHVAFDREGDALLAWVRVTHDYPYQWRVEMLPRSRDGAWGTIVAVSPAGQAPRHPKVALDDDGDGVVAWHAFDGTDHRVFARRVSRTGGLGPVEVLSGTGVTAHGTAVAIDADGDALVTWDESQGDGTVVAKARRFTRDGSLPAELVLSSGYARAETPAVAIDGEGDALLAWANDNSVQARTLSASGALGELRTVSADLSPIDRHFMAKVTVDRDGDALVTWKHWTAADGSDQVWGRWMSRDGTIGEVRQLTPSAHTALSNYALAGDLDGDVVVTWDRFPSAEMYLLRISPTGAAGEPILVTSRGRINSARVDDDGDGVLVWEGEGIDGAAASVRARRVGRDGALGPEHVIVGNGRSPHVAVTPTGGALIAWERRFQVDLMILASVG
jgi:hypothetical protein